MRFHFALLLLFSCVACCISMEDAAPAEHSGKPLEWRWSKDKASLAYSAKQHLPDYEIERLSSELLKTSFPINIRTKQDRAIIYSYKDASESTVFTRWKDKLYIAEYSSYRTGCVVAAVDLKSGKRLWGTRLQGIGPTNHSKYDNFVNIETDGKIIIVAGKESNGRYVEHLDIQTGKTLANKKFDVVK